MKTIFSKLSFKVGTLTAVGVFFAFAIVAFAAPRVATVTYADGCGTYANPVFNPFPVTWGNLAGNDSPGVDCNDFAIISGNVTTASNYAPSFSAQAGDTIQMRIYVHNGAASNSGAVMHNVQVNTNIDYNSGSVNTTLSASNAASVSGSAQINLAPGTHLVLVSGNISPTIGDMQPCFQYSQQFYFTLQVVANAPTAPAGQNTISAQVGSQLSAQCLYTGTVTWTNASNVTATEVTVQDVTANSSSNVLGGGLNSSASTPWLTPGHQYQYIMYDTSNGGQTQIAQTTENVPALNCGTPASTGQNTISAQVGSQISGQCLYTGTVTWSNASNITGTEITVQDVTANSSVNLLGGGLNSSASTPWLTPGDTYQFVMYDTSNGAHTQIAQASENVPALNCGQPSSNPSGSITFGQISPISGQCLYTDNVSWTTSGGVTGAELWVTDLATSVSQQMGGATSGSLATPWLTPGHSYSFVLYNTSNGTKTQLAVQDLIVPNNNPACTVASTPTVTGTITANYTTQLGSVCLYDGFANWTTQNTPSVLVTVEDTTTGVTKTLSTSGSSNGNFETPWLTPGDHYQYILYNTNNGQSQLATAQFTVPGLNCGSTPTPTPTPQPTPTPNQTFTATATASATASASANCSVGGSATASASASASASATSNISQQDAQNKAQAQAQSNAQAQAQSNANAQASVNCPSAPPVCQPNGNFAINASAVVKQGSTYSSNITWTTTGSNQIKLVQVNPDGSQTTLAVGSASGSFTANGLAAGNSYAFKIFDASCGGFLTSTTVTTPANPGQLICSAQSSSYNLGTSAVFTATGGNAPYTWNGSGSPSFGNGSTFSITYSVSGTETVVVNSADGQSAQCSTFINAPTPTPTPTPTPVTTGNCNNGTNSCNTNTNTNTSTNTGSTNSSNQNNNTNINGNNNTVTNSNENCVNNSCNSNTVFITSGGTVVPANQFSQLSITKLVSDNGSGYQNSVSARNGDTVNFQIVVTNSGNAVANNVRLTDNLPAGLNLISGNANINGGYGTSGNLSSGMYLGNLSAGQSITVNYSATVNGYSSASIQNVASASSDNAGTVQASAWVFVSTQVVGCTYNCGSVQGASVNLTYSKSAFNNTQNADATSVIANREDYITYTLTAQNSGNVPANNFVITDDLSQVLPYAAITDNGGGSVSANVISFPGITVPAGGSVTRSFEVRVNYSLATNLSYTMTNTYGNTVSIRINTPQQVLGAFTAPKTGADTMGFAFSGILTAGFAVFKKRKDLLKVIFS